MATKKAGVKSGITGEAPAKKAKAADKPAPAVPVKPEAEESREAQAAEALPSEKQQALEAVRNKVYGLLNDVIGVIGEFNADTRSTRWIDKRVLQVQKEIDRHLDKAARRA